jgi:hypothetical protein
MLIPYSIQNGFIYLTKRERVWRRKEGKERQATGGEGSGGDRAATSVPSELLTAHSLQQPDCMAVQYLHHLSSAALPEELSYAGAADLRCSIARSPSLSLCPACFSAAPNAHLQTVASGPPGPLPCINPSQLNWAATLAAPFSALRSHFHGNRRAYWRLTSCCCRSTVHAQAGSSTLCYRSIG